MDRTIKLWDIKTSQCVRTLIGHTGSVAALTILKNGLLASGSYDETIKTWDKDSGQLMATLSGHTNYVVGLIGLSSGYLASASWDKTIKIWKEDENSTEKTHPVDDIRLEFDHRF